MFDVVESAIVAIDSIERNSAEANAGSHCQYCPAAGDCAEQYAAVIAAVSQDFNDLDGLSKALDNRKMVEGWLKSVSQKALDALRQGERIKGYKLVAGRGRRSWTDDQKVLAVAKTLGVSAAESKIMSPAALEKAVGRKGFALSFGELVHKSVGAAAVVANSDKRKSILEMEFENV